MANNISYGPSTITSRVYDITLLSGNWIGASAPYTYSVNVMMNINSSDTVFILPSYSITKTQNTALSNAIIIDGGISSNVITLKALGTKPTVNIPVRLVISDSGYIKSIYEINGLINASTNEFLKFNGSNTSVTVPGLDVSNQDQLTITARIFGMKVLKVVVAELSLLKIQVTIFN